MVSGSLALLYFLHSFHRGRQGSGPDRGQSLVDGEIFHSFVHPSVSPSGPSSQAWGPASQPSLYRTVPYWGRCSASPHENYGESRAGQGNRWPLMHLMPLDYLFQINRFFLWVFFFEAGSFFKTMWNVSIIHYWINVAWRLIKQIIPPLTILTAPGTLNRDIC